MTDRFEISGPACSVDQVVVGGGGHIREWVKVRVRVYGCEETGDDSGNKKGIMRFYVGAFEEATLRIRVRFGVYF